MAIEKAGLRAVLENVGGYLASAKQIERANAGLTASFAKTSSTSGTLITGLGKLVAAAGVAAAALGTVAASKAAAFERQLAQIDGLTNLTTEDTAKLGKEVLNLAKRFDRGAAELGAGAYYILSSGVNDVATAMEVLEISAKGASLGLGQTQQVADVLTSVLNAYGKETITAARAGDILAATVREGKGEASEFAGVMGNLLPLSSALGVKFEEVGTLLATLTNTGSNAHEAATQLRGIMAQLAAPSAEAKKRLEEAGYGAGKMSKEFVKGTIDATALFDAELDLKQASANLAIERKEAAAVLKKNGATSIEYKKAELALSKATEAAGKAQAKVNEIQEAGQDRYVETADVVGDLQQQIKDKGLIKVLFELNDAFAGSTEALDDVFPDIRGFIGFLSAIQSQGAKTAEVQKRIEDSTGLLDDAFEKVRKTTSFQAGVLKNNLNVALIELGFRILPQVNAAFAKAREIWPSVSKTLQDIAHLFQLGFGGGQIYADLTQLQQLAFDLGTNLGKIYKFIKENQDLGIGIVMAGGTGALVALQTMVDLLGWFLANKDALAVAFAVAFGIFAVTNPVWAGILVGGAILVGIGAFRGKIEELPTPMLKVRAGILQMALALLNFVGIVKKFDLAEKLGLPSITDDLNGLEDGLRNQLAQINDEVHNRDQVNAVLDRTREKLADITGLSGDLATDLATVLNNLPAIGPSMFGDFDANQITDMLYAFQQLTGLDPFAKFPEAVLRLKALQDQAAAFPPVFAAAVNSSSVTVTTAVEQWKNQLNEQEFNAAGQAMVGGLVNGVEQAAPQLTAAFDKLAQNVKDKFENDFGIASPSKVMTAYGHQLGKGLSLGLLQSAARDVNSATDFLVELVNGKWQKASNDTYGTGHMLASSLLKGLEDGVASSADHQRLLYLDSLSDALRAANSTEIRRLAAKFGYTVFEDFSVSTPGDASFTGYGKPKGIGSSGSGSSGSSGGSSALSGSSGGGGGSGGGDAAAMERLLYLDGLSDAQRAANSAEIIRLAKQFRYVVFEDFSVSTPGDPSFTGYGKPYANGGIIRRPGQYTMAEGWNPEMIIPLNRPARARELLRSLPAGVGGGGSGGMNFNPQATFNATSWEAIKGEAHRWLDQVMVQGWSTAARGGASRSAGPGATVGSGNTLV